MGGGPIAPGAPKAVIITIIIILFIRAIPDKCRSSGHIRGVLHRMARTLYYIVRPVAGSGGTPWAGFVY